MAEPLYKDLLVTDEDITLDAGRNPVMVYDRDCIAQDLVHMIRETGLLVELLGNRNEVMRAATLIKLELAIEEDERVVPGSVIIEEPKLGELYVVVESNDFGPIEFMATAKQA